MKLLLGCTKGKLSLRKSIKDKDYYLDNGSKFNIIPKEDYKLNGKVVAECDYDVEKIKLIEIPEYAGDECNTFLYDVSINFETETLTEDELCKQCCLTPSDLDEYLDLYKEKDTYGYVIHIKNLKIFEEPKEITKFTYCNSFPKRLSLTYREDNEHCLPKVCFIIPRSPEELCRILNGEQKSIVCKTVPKEMR